VICLPRAAIAVKRAPALLLLATLASCAYFKSQDCAAGLGNVTTVELFFGRNIPSGGSVSDEDWRRFLDREVTPRFPQGLTVTDAYGQWRDADGVIAREPSKRLLLILSGAPEEGARIMAVTDAYKKEFRQDSVLLVQNKACAAF
jgi:hypothetical protein